MNATIEHLTAYDLEHMPTVTLVSTGEKLPVLGINGKDYTVTAIHHRQVVTIPFEDCEGGN